MHPSGNESIANRAGLRPIQIGRSDIESFSDDDAEAARVVAARPSIRSIASHGSGLGASHVFWLSGFPPVTHHLDSAFRGLKLLPGQESRDAHKRSCILSVRIAKEPPNIFVRLFVADEP